MNIFYLNNDPFLCAQAHVDKHVVKMILEYAQLLSTAHRVLDGEQYTEKKYVLGSFPARWRNIKRWKLANEYHDKMLYKATHIMHPSAVWVRQSDKNYNWLANVLLYLCEEYTHRYGRYHKIDGANRPGDGISFILYKNLPKNIPNAEFTEPPQAMPDIYKSSESAIVAYRNYYIGGKARFATWKNREIAEWFVANGTVY